MPFDGNIQIEESKPSTSAKENASSLRLKRYTLKYNIKSLKKARNFLSRERRWCKGASYKIVSTVGPFYYTQHCSLGALCRFGARSTALDAIAKEIQPLHYKRIEDWNDSTSTDHESLMRVFSGAIARLEAELKALRQAD